MDRLPVFGGTVRKAKKPLSWRCGGQELAVLRHDVRAKFDQGWGPVTTVRTGCSQTVNDVTIPKFSSWRRSARNRSSSWCSPGVTCPAVCGGPCSPFVELGGTEPARTLGHDTVERCRRALGPYHLLTPFMPQLAAAGFPTVHADPNVTSARRCWRTSRSAIWDQRRREGREGNRRGSPTSSTTRSTAGVTADGKLRRLGLNGVVVTPLLPMVPEAGESYVDPMTSMVRFAGDPSTESRAPVASDP